ncbi:tetratricopeptide repeat protein [Oxalobacter paraformigenes]|uniref:Sel1 repeat family protein n=1 Tax=Oxalobacter paraformigenes TaxID=556268 RepID=C3X5S7_9BURK|nr:SEL1-like repeat protein [Oxalobacter paraformigenes]EEO28563.2 hypothetical protein OFAG_01716 [Oxalobacter paraformigenes]
MASREELQLLRKARTGDTASQFALGELYLFGSKSLPQSLTTALHWLGRAARQGDAAAKRLIGNHIPYEVANLHPDRQLLERWYRDALDEGCYRAGLVLAKLLLSSGTATDSKKRSEAIAILEKIVDHDIPEAQWLLAELVKNSNRYSPLKGSALKWTACAANAGIVDAQIALIEHAWKNADYETFLQHALPIARSLLQSGAQPEAADTDGHSARLLLRCGQLLFKEQGDSAAEEIQSMWEMAARYKNAEAAFLLGLWHARMDENGKRTLFGAGPTSFKKAIHWLTQAGGQGLPKAWYALSLIYQKAEFSQRNLSAAQRYLETAANLGHPRAQYERGLHAWRNRRDNESNDVQAVYWLQKATGNGQTEAATLLDRIAVKAQPALWAVKALQHLTRETVSSHPFLAARLELAAVFGLSRPEALLLDIHSADKGHCLLVDIREFYRRSKRRLILIQTGKERQTVSRIGRLFEKVDCGLKGPEGNYRQRQYRLKTLLPPVTQEPPEDDTAPQALSFQ